MTTSSNESTGSRLTGAHRPAYGLVGDGKLARHLSHYLTLLGVPFRRWSRRMQTETGAHWNISLRDCPVILLAISDRAIVDVAREIKTTPGFENKKLVHFSGALHSELAFGFHPLMSFADTFFDLKSYERIPFIGDQDGPALQELFPKFQNPFARLPSEKKALYHAWCVMGGNFSAFLSSRMLESFEERLGLDPRLAIPYLRQVSENLLSRPNEPRKSWTGPLVRKDMTTIEANLKALEKDPYEMIYRAFVTAHGLSREPSPPLGDRSLEGELQ